MIVQLKDKRTLLSPRDGESVERHPGRPPIGLSGRRSLPHSPEEAEQRYVATRDEWLAAMRRASSGRPADLAALAIAQEAYEAAAAELERWRRGERVAIPVGPGRGHRSVDAIVGQELAWRRVRGAGGQDEGSDRGLLARMLRRLRRR